jgi:putative ABC transport system ATP-binding protein
LIGSNGAGKSTLLSVIAGDTLPDAGRVAIDCTDVTRWPAYRRSRLVGRVFQDWTLGTAPALTVGENLAVAQTRASGRTFRRSSTAAARLRSMEILGTVGAGLEDRMDVRAGLFSAGQRQTLAMAMAVASQPALLLLDEHTAALDPVNAEAVMRSTDKLARESGITTLMVTHNMNDAVRYGSRLVVMRHGRIHFDISDQEKRELTVTELIDRLSAIDLAPLGLCP